MGDDGESWNIGRARSMLPAGSTAVVAPAAPVATASAPSSAWSGSAAAIITGVGVVIAVEAARKPDSAGPRGYDVDPPDDDDVEACEKAVSSELSRRFGAIEVPWWLGISMAFGNLYLGVRQSRRKIPGDAPDAVPVEVEKKEANENNKIPAGPVWRGRS